MGELISLHPQAVSSSALVALAAAMEDAPDAADEEIRRTVGTLLVKENKADGLLARLLRRAPPHALVNAVADATIQREKAKACHNAIEDELGGAARLSEREVLAAGERIASIHKSAGAHANALQELSAQFGESKGTGHDGFAAVVAQQAEVLAAFPAAFEVLRERVDAQQVLANRASEHTSRILGLASAIEKITTTVNILGINALISASEAGQYAAGFSIVARELRKLAARTKEASNSIAQLAHELTQILPALKTSNSEISHLCRDRAQALRETVTTHSESLRRAHNEVQATVSKAIKDATDRGISIAADCNDLLSHLMFQDRLQQHVISALRIAELWLSDKKADSDSLQLDIQRLRIGTERLAHHNAKQADRSEGVQAEAGALSFL